MSNVIAFRPPRVRRKRVARRGGGGGPRRRKMIVGPTVSSLEIQASVEGNLIECGHERELAAQAARAAAIRTQYVRLSDRLRMSLTDHPYGPAAEAWLLRRLERALNEILIEAASVFADCLVCHTATPDVPIHAQRGS
jgi:hypothetical protein